MKLLIHVLLILNAFLFQIALNNMRSERFVVIPAGE